MFFKHSTLSDAPLMAKAVYSACYQNAWDSDLQPQFLNIIFKNLMGHDCDFNSLDSITVEEFLSKVPDQRKRNEVIDLMLTVEMLCPQISQAATESITTWSHRLGVDHSGLALLRNLANKSIALAQHDFYRNNYYHTLDLADPNYVKLEEKYGLPAIMLTVEQSPELLAKYDALEFCPSGSLGRLLWEFYKQRGFTFPGSIGGVNHAVAHHDWIHILADYDSDGIGEMEVAAFSAMTTDSTGALMAFLGVLSIFQGGLLKTIVGTAPHLGHELEVANGPLRIADAIRRGKQCGIDLVTEIDFFDYANIDVLELRNKWNITAKA
jgi:hypothetical protein